MLRFTSTPGAVMGGFTEAALRARTGVANNDAKAVVLALEPHLPRLRTGRHLGATLDLAWALGCLGRCREADTLLRTVAAPDAPTRLSLNLARAGLF